MDKSTYFQALDLTKFITPSVDLHMGTIIGAANI